MNLYLFLAPPILGNAFFAVMAFLAAGACFIFGVLHNSWRLEDLDTTPQNAFASNDNFAFSSGTDSVMSRAASVRDHAALRWGWGILALALLLRGVSSILYLYARNLPKILFSSLLIAVPILVGIALFLLLSPRHEEAPVVISDENEYSNSESGAREKVSVISCFIRLFRNISSRDRANALAVFDSFLIGGSLAVIGWWIVQETRVPISSAFANSLPTERARAVANALWFMNASWIFINLPIAIKSRLGMACDRAFADDISAHQNFDSTRDLSLVAQNRAAIQCARAKWHVKKMRPILAFFAVGTLLFCWMALHAQTTPTTSLFDASLLVAASLCYGAAAWTTKALQEQKFVDPKFAEESVDDKNASQQNSDNEMFADAAIQDATEQDFSRSSTQSHAQSVANDIKAQKMRAAAAYKSDEETQVDESAQKTATSISQILSTRNFLTLLLPCAATAVGTWHISHFTATKVAPLNNVIWPSFEIWWGALLMFCASLRHLSLNWLENMSSGRNAAALQSEVGTLRDEVKWRTQQLTTLHSVSADLNNTLSNEQVLNTALQRLMESVRAEAGAVWLLANFEQVAVDKTSRNWNAELRRKNESGLESETKDGETSTRSASDFASDTLISTASANNGVAPRLNLADAADEIGAAPSTNRGASKTLLAGQLKQQPVDERAERAKAAAEKTTSAIVDKLTEEKANIAAKPLSSSDIRKSRAVNNSFQKAVRALNGLEDDEEIPENPQAKGLAGAGIYVSGPIGEWGDFVSSTNFVSSPVKDSAAEIVTHTGEPIHRVSHTRDTYGPNAQKSAAENGNGAAKSPAVTSVSNANASNENVPVAKPDAVSSTRNGVSDAKNVDAQSDEDLGFTHRNWRLVRATGYDTPVLARALAAMNRALEEGGLARCARLSATWFGVIGDVHLAPIRWHGEVVGVLSVTSRQRSFANADRRLLESLANEVSSALRNSYVYRQARRWAERDGVTNLFNHRAMQEKIGQEMLRARNSKTEMTVVMMDLNNFKFFNDTYGHPVGDGVLVTVAQCLRECCRATDIVGRYGGDEFIVLLPNSNAKDALEICRRIEASVEQHAYAEGGGEERRIPIGFSFGAAVYPHDGRTPLELLTVADTNLYDAKRGGSPLAQMKGNEETQELRLLKDAGVGGSFGVLDALVTAIDNKDHYTRRHSEDVTQWAVLMAKELGFSEENLRAVRVSGLLHDVGKIAVPDSVLRKPGRLNDDEFAILQQHPVFGALIVKDVPDLPEVLGGIRHHHERFDGKGYPDNLEGENIPMLGRLLAVPDCFSAMTTNRPYRKALTWSEALTEIERGSGTQFDPQMAEAFLEVIARLVTQQNDATPKKKNSGNPVPPAENYPSAYTL